jgi:hypothetical protein
MNSINNDDVFNFNPISSMDPADPLGAALAGINAGQQEVQRNQNTNTSNTTTSTNSTSSTDDDDDTSDVSAAPTTDDSSGDDSTSPTPINRGFNRMRRAGGLDQQSIVSKIDGTGKI